MKILGMVFLVILILACLYLLSLNGRRNAPGVRDFDGWSYAHRGYHDDKEIPENSLAAFRLAVENGFGAELDVHLLKDGSLAVFHDWNLKRMTGEDLILENLTADQVRNHRLLKTTEHIPLLDEVLEIFAGKTPLIVELKTYRGNYAKLCEAACRKLDAYTALYGGRYVVESFDPRVVCWLRRHRPDIIRGQLSTNLIKEDNDLSLPAAFCGTYLFANFLTRPDFIAYCFGERKNLSNRLCRSLWRLSGASWTIKNENDFRIAKKEGLWPIFEAFDPRNQEKKRR